MSYYYEADVYCEGCAPEDAICCSEEETDCPNNCCVCHISLDYVLTSDGVQYVLEYIRESLRSGRKERNTVHKCYDETYYEGRPHKDIVKDWAKDLNEYCLNKKDERLVRKYLSWIETY